MERAQSGLLLLTGALRLLEKELPDGTIDGMFEKTLRLMTRAGLPEESVHLGDRFSVGTAKWW